MVYSLYAQTAILIQKYLHFFAVFTVQGGAHYKPTVNLKKKVGQKDAAQPVGWRNDET